MRTHIFMSEDQFAIPGLEGRLTFVSAAEVDDGDDS